MSKPKRGTRKRRMSDLTKLKDALGELRARHGFIAKANWQCCQSCGWAAIKARPNQPVIFWHQQDHDAFGRDGKLDGVLYLAWAGTPEQIETACAVIEGAGFTVTRPESESRRVRVERSR